MRIIVLPVGRCQFLDWKRKRCAVTKGQNKAVLRNVRLPIIDPLSTEAYYNIDPWCSSARVQPPLTWLAFKNISRAPTLSKKDRHLCMRDERILKARYLPKLCSQNTKFCLERAMSHSRPQFPRSTHRTPGTITPLLARKSVAFSDSGFPYTEARVIIKWANISLCPWSFNQSKFCLVNFHFFDINLRLNLKCRHYKALFTLRVAQWLGEPNCSGLSLRVVTQPNMQGETTYPPELSGPRDRFAIFMWMVD